MAGEIKTQEELTEEQAALVENLGNMVQTNGWKKFVQLVEAKLESHARALISADASKAHQVADLQGRINSLNWALEIPRQEFDRLQQMREALEATQNAKPE